jgi:hypothetical protein
MCAALSNRQIKIDLIVAEGDLVAVRSTWSGKSLWRNPEYVECGQDFEARNSLGETPTSR